jgi:hypothetical protein
VVEKASIVMVVAVEPTLQAFTVTYVPPSGSVVMSFIPALASTFSFGHAVFHL